MAVVRFLRVRYIPLIQIMKFYFILLIILISGACNGLTDKKDCRGSCLLKPIQTYIYLYKSPSVTSQPVDSIINDTIDEDYPILMITDIKDGFAHVEIRSDVDSTFKQAGWIMLNLLGINPATTDMIKLYKCPNNNSGVACYIESPSWGCLYTIIDCSNEWLKIRMKEKGVTKEGWISPADQCDNPYSACN